MRPIPDALVFAGLAAVITSKGMVAGKNCAWRDVTSYKGMLLLIDISPGVLRKRLRRSVGRNHWQETVLGEFMEQCGHLDPGLVSDAKLS